MNISPKKIEKLFEEAFRADASVTRRVDADRVLLFARHNKIDSTTAAYILGRADAMNYIEEYCMRALNGIELSQRVRSAVNAMRDLTSDEFMRTLGKVSGDRLGTH